MSESFATIGVIFALLALAVRILIPKMLDSESRGKRFGIGVVVFLIYTVVTLLMFFYFCTFEGNGFCDGKEVFVRVSVAFLVVNLMVLFGACLYFFTWEKRKLSQIDKMKLKDL